MVFKKTPRTDCWSLGALRRTFTRRIYNLLRDAGPSCNRIALTELAIQDLKWWAIFVVTFNGKARMFNKDCECVVVTTDASSTGFGGHSDYDFFWGFWEEMDTICSHHAAAPREPVYYDNINVGELWPVLTALHRCCALWKDCIVEVVTDNTQVYHELRTGRGSNPTTGRYSGRVPCLTYTSGRAGLSLRITY